MATPLHILLLGGSGFVGRALLREISHTDGVHVRALLRSPETVPEQPLLEKVRGSVESPPANLAPQHPFVLVHFAVKQIDDDAIAIHEMALTHALIER